MSTFFFIFTLTLFSQFSLQYFMKEEFLHYLWKYGLFDKRELKDQEGNIITVISPGEYNRDGGPDFFNGRNSDGWDRMGRKH